MSAAVLTSGVAAKHQSSYHGAGSLVSWSWQQWLSHQQEAKKAETLQCTLHTSNRSAGIAIIYHSGSVRVISNNLIVIWVFWHQNPCQPFAVTGALVDADIAVVSWQKARW